MTKTTQKSLEIKASHVGPHMGRQKQFASLKGLTLRNTFELSRFSYADGHVVFLCGWPRDSTFGRTDCFFS